MTMTTTPPAQHTAETCSRAWFALKNAHDRVAECLGTALNRECGIGISDFEVLLFLGNLDATGVRIGDLAQAVHLSQPALSRLVARLEDRGLVARSKTDDDQRAVFITLTEAGRSMLARAIPLHTACVQAHILSHATDEEQALLVSILDRMS
jgi:DNA-binding MarR family transcriptional regulator